MAEWCTNLVCVRGRGRHWLVPVWAKPPTNMCARKTETTLNDKVCAWDPDAARWTDEGIEESEWQPIKRVMRFHTTRYICTRLYIYTPLYIFVIPSAPPLPRDESLVSRDLLLFSVVLSLEVGVTNLISTPARRRLFSHMISSLLTSSDNHRRESDIHSSRSQLALSVGGTEALTLMEGTVALACIHTWVNCFPRCPFPWFHS